MQHVMKVHVVPQGHEFGLMLNLDAQSTIHTFMLQEVRARKWRDKNERQHAAGKLSTSAQNGEGSHAAVFDVKAACRNHRSRSEPACSPHPNCYLQAYIGHVHIYRPMWDTFMYVFVSFQGLGGHQALEVKQASLSFRHRTLNKHNQHVAVWPHALCSPSAPPRVHAY